MHKRPRPPIFWSPIYQTEQMPFGPLNRTPSGGKATRAHNVGSPLRISSVTTLVTVPLLFPLIQLSASKFFPPNKFARP